LHNILSLQYNSNHTMIKMNQTIHILFSEGSSLSARQTLSALGPLGYKIDVCDPNPLCISRFSRFVHRFHRCPPSGSDPLGYLRFILDRLKQEHYDVLLPVHEQALLFSRIQAQLASKCGIALTDFDQLALLQSKATFSQLLNQLGLPQPQTHFIRSQSDLDGINTFPFYVKLPYSTAGRGVWRVENSEQCSKVIQFLEDVGVFKSGTNILAQETATGLLSQAQAIFEHGHLIAVHCTVQQALGMGGSQSARLGTDHPVVRKDLEILGQHLGWQGALAIDYFYNPETERPLYIEANPRLVEPMNACLSEVNLAEILVRLSLGESFTGSTTKLGCLRVRSHSLMAMLLGKAEQNGSRWELLKMLVQVILRRGTYKHSYEDLTPPGLDPPSLIPLAFVTIQLLINPAITSSISRRTVSDYSLTEKTIEIIRGVREINGC